MSAQEITISVSPDLPEWASRGCTMELRCFGPKGVITSHSVKYDAPPEKAAAKKTTRRKTL